MGGPGNNTLSVICSRRQGEVLPEVGFFCYFCSDCDVAMASVHTFTVGNFLTLRIKLCICIFLYKPFLMETALPRCFGSFAVVCRAKVFCSEQACWLYRALIGSQGLLASEHTEGVYVSICKTILEMTTL